MSRPRFRSLLAGVAVRLGIWQYDAFVERRASQSAALSTEEPVPVDDLLGPDDPFPGEGVGAPVVVAGEWVSEVTFRVGPREQDGRDGSWVVTPVAVGDGQAGDGGTVDEGASALLVVRGWLPEGAPVPEAPSGRTELVAWLQPGEGAGLPDDDPADDVLPELRIADAVQRVDQDLYGGYAVVADRAAPGGWPVGDEATNPGTDGLEPARPDQLPQPGRFTAARNLLYAIEWWVFAAFAGFVWWRFVTEEVALDAAQAEGDAEPEPDAEPKPEPETDAAAETDADAEPGADPVRSDA